MTRKHQLLSAIKISLHEWQLIEVNSDMPLSDGWFGYVVVFNTVPMQKCWHCSNSLLLMANKLLSELCQLFSPCWCSTPSVFMLSCLTIWEAGCCITIATQDSVCCNAGLLCRFTYCRSLTTEYLLIPSLLAWVPGFPQANTVLVKSGRISSLLISFNSALRKHILNDLL